MEDLLFLIENGLEAHESILHTLENFLQVTSKSERFLCFYLLAELAEFPAQCADLLESVCRSWKQGRRRVLCDDEKTVEAINHAVIQQMEEGGACSSIPSV